ncbi:MAG: hypothetical protein ACHQNV_04590 [Vicinamibacteria bacterium]
MRRAGAFILFAFGLAFVAGNASAEPIFLSKQYARCTTCHYSPTGGGLLTPYGRSLSRQELSTTGKSEPTQQQPDITGKEEAFLWGILGKSLGPVDVGIDMRPGYLSFDFGGTSTHQTLWMNADLLAAYRVNGWTVYGEVGREPQPNGSKIDSYEYWVGYESEKGLGVRAGRFLPAYGLRLADHTAYNRIGLGLDIYDQVYGLELSQTTDRHLLQLCVSPGRADSILHNDGLQAFTTTGRFQYDFNSRTTLVASALYRGSSTLIPQNGAGGLSFGFAPTSHVSIWSEADVQFKQGAPGAPAYTLMNETGVEVFRGVWLKFSPQLRTDYGDTSGGNFRMVFEANLLPRTHWNVDASYYRDKSRLNDIVTKTFLLQLHLYI